LSLAGEHNVYFDGNTVSLGVMVVASTLDCDECGLSVTESPLGAGSLEEVEGAWIATFPGDVVADFVFDSASGMFEFEIEGFGVTGYLVPTSIPFEPLGPQDPQGQGPGTGLGPKGPGGITGWATWPPWMQGLITTIDFEQYSRTRIRALVPNPAGGPPVPVDLPPGTSIGTSGNGGVNPSGAQVAQGAGSENVNGTTTYVDSGTGGTPGYVAGGGQGSNGNPGRCNMSDAPGTDGQGGYTSPVPQLGPALAALAGQGQGFAVGIEITIYFTTYLVVNGQPVWVWHWTWTRVEMFGQNLGPGTVFVGPGMPASGLEPRDAGARNDFVNGGFNGSNIP
jgi:hypothetical protein